MSYPLGAEVEAEILVELDGVQGRKTSTIRASRKTATIQLEIEHTHLIGELPHMYKHARTILPNLHIPSSLRFDWQSIGTIC